jgi:hypothetical protein
MRLDQQHARLGHLDRGELLDRDLRAVVIDVDPLDQAGAARPVRTVENWDWTCSTALSILSMASSRVSSVTRPA